MNLKLNHKTPKQLKIKNEVPKSKISSLSTLFKKYKSQGTYLVSPKSFSIKKSPISDPYKMKTTNNSKKNLGTLLNKKKSESKFEIRNEDDFGFKSPIVHPNKECPGTAQQIINSPFNKIMSDSSSQGFDTEENIKSLDFDDEVVDDEIKASEINNDYYISQINENTEHIEKDIVHHVQNILTNPFTIDEATKANSERKSDTNLDTLQRQLLICAKKGDKEEFLELMQKIVIDKNGTINYCDEAKWTALHYACDEGCLKIVEILLKANCDVNVKTNTKKTPLHLSASHGYFDISKMLIENGCSINQFDNEKNSPLHLCAIGGYVELIKFLLSKLPQADTKNIYGKTPYDVATNVEIKELLQKYVSKKENKYHHVTIQQANESNVTQLLKGLPDKHGNININIQTNINNNNDRNRVISKKIQIGEKVKVTVNTKIGNEFIPKSTKNKTSGKNKFGLKNSNPINLSNISSELEAMLHRAKTSGFTKKKSMFPKSKDSPKKSDKGNLSTNISISSNKTEENVNITNPLYSQLGLGSIDEEKITPTSFICLGLLGRGSFGEVYLVKKIDTNVLYAMKILSKNRIKSQNLLKYAMAERNVLSLTNHPFIVKLNFAFQTTNKLFLILDYCPNGDLARQLFNEKRFTEERAKFYICEVALALEDLHKRDIIFRDLKPDNVVLDEAGHAKLTDFGLSKEGVYESNCAKSFCGSIAYLAPEMINRTGHGKAVDWYLLGVLFYEMLVGIPPYFTDRKEEIFRNIKDAELQIPSFISPKASDLIKALLEKDPQKRLGGGIEDANEIKSHPYFSDVNWDNVYKKRIPPPKLKNYSKPMAIFSNPKYFQKDEEIMQHYSSESYLNGWSFVINDETY